MERINSSNKVPDKFGPGKDGFGAGDEVAGVKATFLTPSWHDSVQEEISNVIEAVPIALDPANRTQLLTAIQAMIAAAGGSPGDVKYVAKTAAPAGWLKANGAAVSRTTYAALFAAIGTAFGVGDGSTTFNLPDLRGEFIRGYDDGRGVDVSRVFGSAQLDALQGHGHTIKNASSSSAGNTGFVNGTNVPWNTQSSSTHDGLVTTVQSLEGYGTAHVASETRGRNLAFLPVIKY